MRLTEADGAGAAFDENLEAYEGIKTREYHSYWKYRNTQADPSVYDSGHQVTLSTAERDYYSNVLGWSDDAITALEAKRTDEYHTLHQTYGSVGDTYDDGYSYSVTADEYDSLKAGFSWTLGELNDSMSANILLRDKTDTETRNLVRRNRIQVNAVEFDIPRADF